MGKRLRIAGVAAVVFAAILPAASAAASQYVDLGDSYASGVGTRTFYSESGSCKRSPEAYGPKVAAAKGYTLSFQACSGAKTSDVIAKQLGTLSSSTALVTLSIGGNDAGFSNVIINCALYYFTCGSAITEANNYIAKTLPGVLDTTYNDIRAKATTAHVVDPRLPAPVHSLGNDLQRQLPDRLEREETERNGRQTRRGDQSSRRSPQIHLRGSAQRVREPCCLRLGRVAERAVQPARRKLPPECQRPRTAHQRSGGCPAVGGRPAQSWLANAFRPRGAAPRGRSRLRTSGDPIPPHQECRPRRCACPRGPHRGARPQ